MIQSGPLLARVCNEIVRMPLGRIHQGAARRFEPFRQPKSYAEVELFILGLDR